MSTPEDSILRRHYLHQQSVLESAPATSSASPAAAAPATSSASPASAAPASAAAPQQGLISRLFGKLLGR